MIDRHLEQYPSTTNGCKMTASDYEYERRMTTLKLQIVCGHVIHVWNSHSLKLVHNKRPSGDGSKAAKEAKEACGLTAKGVCRLSLFRFGRHNDFFCVSNRRAGNGE